MAGRPGTGVRRQLDAAGRGVVAMQPDVDAIADGGDRQEGQSADPHAPAFSPVVQPAATSAASAASAASVSVSASSSPSSPRPSGNSSSPGPGISKGSGGGA